MVMVGSGQLGQQTMNAVVDLPTVSLAATAGNSTNSTLAMGLDIKIPRMDAIHTWFRMG